MNKERFFQFEAETYSSQTAGRAIQKVRANHFVIDDPEFEPYNGPGDAPSASEYFLSGITGCGVLMIERIARSEDISLKKVRVQMKAKLNPDIERKSFTVFDEAHMHFSFSGINNEQASRLVHIFKSK